MIRLLKTALLLGIAGGLTYGTGTTVEGLPSQTTGQAARPMEDLLKTREKENSKEAGYAKINRFTDVSRRLTGITTKGGSVQKRFPSRETNKRSAAAPNKISHEKNESTGKRKQISASSIHNRVHHSIHNNSATFLITAYTANYESTQKRPGAPGYRQTASGAYVKEGRTIAADWAVLSPGTVVTIEGLKGTYTVEDKGGAVNGKHIDLYVENLSHAKAWGKQHRKVTILERGNRK